MYLEADGLSYCLLDDLGACEARRGRFSLREASGNVEQAGAGTGQEPAGASDGAFHGVPAGRDGDKESPYHVHPFLLEFGDGAFPVVTGQWEKVLESPILFPFHPFLLDLEDCASNLFLAIELISSGYCPIFLGIELVSSTSKGHIFWPEAASLGDPAQSPSLCCSYSCAQQQDKAGGNWSHNWALDHIYYLPLQQGALRECTPLTWII